MLFISFQVNLSLDCNYIHQIIIGINPLLFLVIISYIAPAVILILEHATVLYSSGTDCDSALEQAQSQYIQFAHAGAAKQFPSAFQDYSNAQLQHFILNNRLSSKQVALS